MQSTSEASGATTRQASASSKDSLVTGGPSSISNMGDVHRSEVAPAATHLTTNLAQALGFVSTSAVSARDLAGGASEEPGQAAAAAMFTRVIHVISRPPGERRHTDMEIFLPWMRKRSELLAKSENDILLRLLAHCAYQKRKRDDVIITQGDIGDSFYIILLGRCSVFIDPHKTGEESRPTQQSTTQPAQAAVLSEMAGKLDRAKYGRHISTMGAGKAFGEIALISEDSARNASIIADEETDLLVIERELFNHTLKAKQEEEYAERSSFVAGCPLFSHWSPRFKKLLEMSLAKISLPFGASIVKQGDPISGLYFIRKGEGKVVMDPTTHTAQYPRLYDPSNSLLARELGKTFARRVEQTRESLQQEQVRVRRRQGYAAAERRLAQKAVTLCCVDHTEVIGDTELVLGLDTYMQTVVCTAPTELFLLDNKNIDRLIVKKNQTTLDLLRLQVEEKIRARSTSLLGAQVTLYERVLEALALSRPKRLTYSPIQPTTTEAPNEEERAKDTAIRQLVRLYLKNYAPLIDPAVPGTVYYKTRAMQRAQRPASTASTAAASLASRPGTTGQLRLERVRRAAKRQPRSRRELERLTIAQDPEEVSKLQDRNHAVNRFLQREPSASVHPRPGSSVSQQQPDSIYSLTAPQAPDNGDDLDLTDLSEQEVKDAVINLGHASDATNATRSRVICSMMEASAQQSASAKYKNLLRPKSAAARLQEPVEHDSEVFDAETSETVLRDLEDKLRIFVDESVNNGASTGVATSAQGTSAVEGGRRMVPQIRKMRRFQITKPDDVPVPGGTVFVRQRSCKYPPGSQISASHHQHVRRFLIPRDAYAVATRSMQLIESALKAEGATSARFRPASAAPGFGTVKQALTNGARPISAPIRSMSSPAMHNRPRSGLSKRRGSTQLEATA